MAYTTYETSAAEEECTVKGTHWVKNMVKTWLNYAYWAKDAEVTWTGAHAFGSRTSGSGLDLGTYEEGLLVATQYTDAAALANTTDYVGCSAIFDLKLGRAITLASGGGYGFATIWANLEVDKAINATGGQSAAWFTVWADAAGADAAITGTSRVQVLDLALVTGAAFNAGASTKIYGLRIDSSANASATMDGEFAAINIEAAGTKKDWTIGIDVNGCTTGIDVAVTSTASGKNGILVSDTFTLATSGVHKAIQGDVTYTPATSGLATSIGVAGKAILNGNFTGGVGYCWGVQGQMDFADAAIVNNASSIFAGVRAVVTATATPAFTACDTICGLYVDILCPYDLSAASGVAAIAYFAHQGGGAGLRGTLDTCFRVQCPNTTNFIDFDDCIAGGSVAGFITPSASAGTMTHTVLCTIDGTDAYLHLYNA